VTNLLFGNQRHEILIAGVDAGTTPRISVFNPDTGDLKFTIMAFENNFTGGVRVAAADMNGDNIPDIIAASGNGRVAEVRVFSGVNGAPLGSFQPFGTSFTGGAFVAVGDINGDGFADIIVGEGVNGPPMVKVYDFHNRTYLGSGFLAYESVFRGGVHVAAADLFGNGRTEIITAPGKGRPPTVEEFAYNGVSAMLLRAITAYDPTYFGGVWVAAETGRIITGPGDSSAPIVKVFNPSTGGLIRSFFAYTQQQAPNGVRIGLIDRDGDGVSDIITAGGSGSQPLVRFFSGVTYVELYYYGFWAFEPEFAGGVFVAGA
jgi:hypothetical protein